MINFVPGPGRPVGDPVLDQPRPGRRSTSPARTAVFQGMWRTDRREHRAATAATRGSSARPGGKDFVFAHAQRRRRRRWPRRWCAAPSSTRGRSAPPPAAPTSPTASGRPSRSRLADEVADDQDGRRRPTSATSWARSSTAAPSRTIKGYIEHARRTERSARSSPAASATTAGATSSSRRWSQADEPAVQARWRRRSSARC